MRGGLRPHTPRAAARSKLPRIAGWVGVAALLLAACWADPIGVSPPRLPPAAPTGAATAPAPGRRAPASLTILYTSDEHGWLFGQGEGEKTRGGTAEALAQWIADEGHCPLRAQSVSMGPQAAPTPGALRAPDPAAQGACKDPGTVLLSGGDNFTGPAISSYFRGAPMAEAMARMGYVASAFGNHEFDFDREAFEANRTKTGAIYLAANVRARDPRRDPGLVPSILVDRRGLKLGVIGIATEHTPREALPSRFDGLVFEAAETALDREVGAVYARGADAVVVVAHACEDEIAPVVEKHPEWRLAFVGIGHCHRRSNKTIGGTPIVMPAWRLDAYARVTLAIDPNRAPRDRVTAAAAELVNVRPREGLAPDAGVAAIRDAAKVQLDAALGATIGFSASGMDDDSEAMGRWITSAVREELRVDVALTNWSGIRQSVSPGAITKATVYSVLPFENQVYLLKVSGAVIGRLLGERAFVVSGAKRVEIGRKPTKGGDRAVYEVRLDSGTVVDPARTYTVAVSDFLYDLGKDFDFAAADPSPVRSGIDWRAPVIAWTAKAATTEKAPLEAKVGGSTKPPPKKKKAQKK
jgi:5'-nucleotidase/UDP-sugar diphosphatase